MHGVSEHFQNNAGRYALLFGGTAIFAGGVATSAFADDDASSTKAGSVALCALSTIASTCFYTVWSCKGGIERKITEIKGWANKVREQQFAQRFRPNEVTRLIPLNTTA